MKSRTVGSMVGFALLVTTFSACATTGPGVSSQEERRAAALLAIKAQAWQREQEQRMLRIAARLMEVAEAPKPLQFRFLASKKDAEEARKAGMSLDDVNAWTDGETVYVTRGIMRFLKTDDELAVILGHEMTHALRGHLAGRAVKQTFGLVLGTLSELVAPGTGQSVYNLFSMATMKFDRDQEREADLYGFMWAYKAGFDPAAGAAVWERWTIEMPESTERSFLASHPASPERMTRAQKVAEMLKAGLDPTRPAGAEAPNADVPVPAERER